MYCGYCGKKLEDSAIYCGYCGKPTGRKQNGSETGADQPRGGPAPGYNYGNEYPNVNAGGSQGGPAPGYNYGNPNGPGNAGGYPGGVTPGYGYGNPGGSPNGPAAGYGYPANGLLQAWTGPAAFGAIAAWAMTGINVFLAIMMLIEKITDGFGGGFALLCLVHVFLYTILAMIGTYSMRTRLSEREREDIFVCVQTGFFVTLVILILRLIIKSGIGYFIFDFLVYAGLMVLLFFCLGQPKTLLSKPYALLALPSAFINMMRRQQPIRIALRAYRREKAAWERTAGGQFVRQTVLLRMVTGLAGAVLQFIALFLPICTSVTVYTYSYKYRFLDFRYEDGGAVMLVALFAAVGVCALLAVLKKPKITLIPTCFILVVAILCVAVITSSNNVYGIDLNVMHAGAGIILLFAGAAVAFVGAFVRMPVKH